jgi:hypothetical protein
MKRLLLISVLVLLVALSVTAVALATPAEEFSLKKVCDLPPTVPACRLTEATGPFSVLNGGLIVYQDRAYFENTAGVFEVARVVLTSEDGESTMIGQIRWVKDHGYFTLGQGTGDLNGLHATGDIQWLEDVTFSLSGAYH